MTTITSKANQHIQFAKDISRGKEKGYALLEGAKLCRDALAAGITPLKAFVTEGAPIPTALLDDETTFVINDALSRFISDTETPQGVFLVVPALDKNENSDRIVKSGKILILDGVQEPGNAGTLLRTAAAFGASVVLSTGSANPNSGKFIRASAGAVLTTPVIRAELAPIIGALKQNGCKVYAAMLDDKAKPLCDVTPEKKVAVVIGSEGKGVSAAVAAMCDTVYIPISGVQSLNAATAGGIIMYSLFSNRKRN
ncbi:MAG: RNA methyltransferase [Oscillospiraceae bacterium]|jgi:TrmH family RNA methyltransferase|nr:RNA methyltransferase [Oscillospiraceae bacterium]